MGIEKLKNDPLAFVKFMFGDKLECVVALPWQEKMLEKLTAGKLTNV